MKPHILFEKGKLYVVELPYIKPERCKSPCRNLEWCTCIEPAYQYDQDFKRALANKVEVKNPEQYLPIAVHEDKYMLIHEKGHCDDSECAHFFEYGDTFPLPAYLTFDKETGMLKRIEPEKLEESQEELLAELLAKHYKWVRSGAPLHVCVSRAQDSFTIQRKKS